VQISSILLILVLVSGSFNFAFADYSTMKEMFPQGKHLSKNWTLSGFGTKDDIHLPFSTEKPDGVAKRYSLNSTSSNSQLICELHILEFENEFKANQIRDGFVTYAPTEGFEELRLQDNTKSRCKAFGKTIDGQEVSAIICTSNNYVIISSSREVGGKVYEGDTRITPIKVSAGFVTFVLENIIRENKVVIPEWIKNNAKWWSMGIVTDSEFVASIEYMIKNDLIQTEHTDTNEFGKSIPEWVRNNAKWWSEGQISDKDFVKGLEHLVKIGIIRVSDK
jgi:predicted house-cleaning noncanonical NTP pyrophosphatase (MazG superfamily)